MSFWPPEKGSQYVENIYWGCSWHLKKKSTLLLLFSWSDLSERMTLTARGEGLWKMTRGSTVVQSPTAHLSRSTTRISHANSTNSGNAKMLMPTFTRGSEVGLFKQREVCKVRERITHSQCASEGHTSVNQPECTVILDGRRTEPPAEFKKGIKT